MASKNNKFIAANMPNNSVVGEQEQKRRERMAALSGKKATDTTPQNNDIGEPLSNNIKLNSNNAPEKKKRGRPKREGISIAKTYSISKVTDQRLSLYATKFDTIPSAIIDEAVELLCKKNFPEVDNIIDMIYKNK